MGTVRVTNTRCASRRSSTPGSVEGSTQTEVTITDLEEELSRYRRAVDYLTFT